MGIETTVVDRKDKQTLFELPTVVNTNSKSKRGRRPRQRKVALQMSPVQKLFMTCKEVFAFSRTGFIPPPEDIQRLQAVLDDMKPEDVGLHPEMPYFRTTLTEQAPAIAYLHLHECEKFSMGIFCLPPKAVLPLHNHPGMTVFSKLLFGTMHIKSYDWVTDGNSNTSTIVNPPEIDQPGVRLAKVKVDYELTAPCNTSILYPAEGGNMHCFTAVTACAVLDVLGPPYSDPDGRHCTYYLDFPFSKFSFDGVSVPEDEREGYAWLEEREKPDDLAVVGAMYRGPKIVED